VDQIDEILQWLETALHWPLFTTAKTEFTPVMLIYLVVLLVLLFWSSRLLQRWLADGPLFRNRLDVSARHAASALARYLFLFLGLLFIVESAGVDLTTFKVLAGAIGIGVGFGMQNVVSNFIAGLIIMFERPVKIGDRIVVGEIEGNVIDIGARSTTVLDNDNINVIVPNSKFITDDVINWNYNDDQVRFRIPVSVAYGSDARQVERVLLEIAAADADVLAEPEPSVRLLQFGDNGLQFELCVWSATRTNTKVILRSSLNFAIYDRFLAENISFPFPQRDLHLRSGVLEIRRAAPAV
jgi:small-conductance mechanosensitive channel